MHFEENSKSGFAHLVIILQIRMNLPEETSCASDGHVYQTFLFRHCSAMHYD